MTIAEVKQYEVDQYTKAFYKGTDKAWKQYRANVKKVVNSFNKTHDEQIDIDALMA